MPAALWLTIALAAGIPAFFLVYSSLFQFWYRRKTQGDQYFSLPLSQRLAFRQQLLKHAVFLLPFYRFMAKGLRKKQIPALHIHGIALPAAITTEASVKTAMHYPPDKDDIFVATFMRSGTTWMQNIVFELLHHGEGDLGDNGYHHLYAMSPWIECSPHASVSMKDAPLVSEYRKRIIKTHLPAQLCPLGQSARYIYVARNPVNTFNSCVDFFSMLMGPFCPDRQSLSKLFCSADMFWGRWPEHVLGWYQLAQNNPNVLFITYEDLQANTTQNLHVIADFLGLSIRHAELKRVADKVSLETMQDNEACFEMSPPNLFSVTGSKHFIQGKTRKICDEASQAVKEFCQKGIQGANAPLLEDYFSGENRQEY